MVKHSILDGEYGKHITNEKVDDIDTLIGYICNVENVNKFKILIGGNNIKANINNHFNLEDDTRLPFIKNTVKLEDNIGDESKPQEKHEYYTVKELSEKVRHRLYHIKHNDKVLSVFKELFSDINAMVNVKQKEFLIGIDKTKKNIEPIYKLIKETFDMLEIENYTIYVYEGVENGKKDNC